jgi:hypothetical protein
MKLKELPGRASAPCQVVGITGQEVWRFPENVIPIKNIKKPFISLEKRLYKGLELVPGVSFFFCCFLD